jgi:hypothetical protein
MEHRVLQAPLRIQRPCVDADFGAGTEHTAGGQIGAGAALAGGAEDDGRLEQAHAAGWSHQKQAQRDSGSGIGGAVIVPLPVDIGDHKGGTRGNNVVAGLAGFDATIGKDAYPAELFRPEPPLIPPTSSSVTCLEMFCPR